MIILSESQQKKLSQIGTMLKFKREELGYSIKRVADITRISSGNITFIEDGEFDKFSSIIFIKGFIKNYATFLGLNIDWINAELTKIFAAENEKVAINDVLTRNENKSLSTIQLSQFKFLLIGLTLLIFISLVVSYIYFNADYFSFSKNENFYSFSKNNIETTKKISNSVSEKKSTLVIKSNSNGWIRLIDINSNNATDYNVQSDDMIKFQGKNKYKIILSSANIFSLNLNDKEISLPNDLENKLYITEINFNIP